MCRSTTPTTGIGRRPQDVARLHRRFGGFCGLDRLRLSGLAGRRPGLGRLWRRRGRRSLRPGGAGRQKARGGQCREDRCATGWRTTCPTSVLSWMRRFTAAKPAVRQQADERRTLALRAPDRPAAADPPGEASPYRYGRLFRPSVAASTATDGRDKILWGWVVAAACILSMSKTNQEHAHDRAAVRRNRLRSQ